MRAFGLSVAMLLLPSISMAKEFIVKLKPGTHIEIIDRFENDKNFTHLKLSFGRFYRFDRNKDTHKAISNLIEEHKKSIAYIQEVRQYRGLLKNTVDQASPDPIEEHVDDPLINKQWALNNTGTNSSRGNGIPGFDMNIVPAWQITKGSQDIKVAVIDSGINYRHPDLRDNIWINESEQNGEEGVDDDNNGYIDDIYGYDFVNNDADPDDDHGHGSHCSGIIGASHNQIGIAGINAEVKIMAIKFLDSRINGDTIGAIKSIDYAMKMGADVMSNSWGGNVIDQALEDAVAAAVSKGVIFVAAAGNSGSNNDNNNMVPANYDKVISVASYRGHGFLAFISNWGPQSVHAAAPGDEILSTHLNESYVKLSGTSMACPHVAGLAALLLSQEPNISPIDMRNRIMSSSVYHESWDGVIASKGRVDAHRFLTIDK